MSSSKKHHKKSSDKEPRESKTGGGKSESVVDKRGIFAEEYVGEDWQYTGTHVKHQNSRSHNEEVPEKDHAHSHRHKHHHQHHHHQHHHHQHHHHQHHHHQHHHHHQYHHNDRHGRAAPTHDYQMHPAGGSREAIGSNHGSYHAIDRQPAANNEDPEDRMIVVIEDEGEEPNRNDGIIVIEDE